MNKTDILWVDTAFAPKLSDQEARELQKLQTQFMDSYAAHTDMEVGAWLRMEMGKHLPDRKPDEIAQMSQDIIQTLKLQQEKKDALDKAISQGRDKKSWFASEMKKAVSKQSTQEAARYLQGLDDAVQTANEALENTFRTQSGAISQNPNLDGFLAEQHHAQTFNMNAQARGSEYRAEVLEPDGHGYGKNSVDVVIKDGQGNIVRRYQMKYGKDSVATEKMFEHGDYRGQQKVIPKGQKISKKSTNVLEAPDGTKSNPLTKEQAKKAQMQAQDNKPPKYDWNSYQMKDVAMGIAKEVGKAAVLGAAVSTGFSIARRVWNGDKVKSEEVVKTALETGKDIGIKAAASGALKVGAEKGLISAIPKGTPASTIANIVHVGVENVKVLSSIIKGKCTVQQGLERMERVTGAAIAGIAGAAKGAAIGATVGSLLGPVGTAVGGFVGGTIGHMAGSKVGKAVVKTYQKVRNTATKIVKTTVKAVGKALSSVADKVFSFFDL